MRGWVSERLSSFDRIRSRQFTNIRQRLGERERERERDLQPFTSRVTIRVINYRCIVTTFWLQSTTEMCNPTFCSHCKVMTSGHDSSSTNSKNGNWFSICLATIWKTNLKPFQCDRNWSFWVSLIESILCWKPYATFDKWVAAMKRSNWKRNPGKKLNINLSSYCDT